MPSDPLSATELRRAWTEVNNWPTAAFERFSLEDWPQNNAAVSDEDFAKDPARSRLAIVMSRSNTHPITRGQAIHAM
jgi:hypothetical protein